MMSLSGTRKVCLRCDWHGDTTEPGCPDCGERPLYVIDRSPPRKVETPAAPDSSERGRRETGAAAVPVLPPREPDPGLDPPPPQTEADGPPGRRDHVVALLVVVALVLTISAGTWLTGRAQRPPPSASADAVGAGDLDGASPTPSSAISSPSSDVAPIVDRAFGRQVLTVGGVPVSFRVPAPGWERFGQSSLNKSIIGPQGAEAMLYWSSFPEGGRADPCPNLSGLPVDPTATDLADAVATAPGTELSTASDATLGGRPAEHVVLTVRKPSGCNPGFFYSWKDFKGGALFPRTTIGDSIEVWIVDVGGTTLFFGAVTTEQADRDLNREIRAIFGSFRFLTQVPGEVEIATRFMRARNDHDIDTAMSLLSKDGATVSMQNGYSTDPNMPVVRMDRNQLALALEVEELYGVLYDSTYCRWEPHPVIRTAPVVCTYRMDNTLRQILGFQPVTSSVSIGVRHQRVTHLSFPWLNVSYPSAMPPEFAEFVAWLGAEHPDAGQVYEDGELFTTSGQELVHILTRRSVDLLASHLEEYERSLTG